MLAPAPNLAAEPDTMKPLNHAEFKIIRESAERWANTPEADASEDARNAAKCVEILGNAMLYTTSLAIESARSIQRDEIRAAEARAAAIEATASLGPGLDAEIPKALRSVSVWWRPVIVSELLLCGVYALCERGEVVYIGQSSNILYRIGSHVGLKRFDQCVYLPCPCDRMAHVEAWLIHALKPRDNVTQAQAWGTLDKPTWFDELHAAAIDRSRETCPL